MDDEREIEMQQFWRDFGSRLRDALTPYAEQLWRDDFEFGSKAGEIQRGDRHWLQKAIDRAAPVAGPLDVAPFLWLRRYILGEVKRDEQQVQAVQDLVATLALAETGRLGEHFPLPVIDEPAPYDPPITREAAQALEVLAGRHPVLTPLEEIGLAPATNKQAADELIGLNLASRPNGPRKGLALTPAGLTLANKLSANL